MSLWLSENVEKGNFAVGTFVQTPNIAVGEVLASLPFDFLCLETEHSGYSCDVLSLMTVAAERWSMPSLVRVASNDPVLIAQALDAGAAGVVVPRINSASEAIKAVSAARYPPAGSRGVGPGRAAQYGNRMGEYIKNADTHTKVLLQIETRQAVDQLDAILQVEGLDYIFIGPGDLAMSYRDNSREIPQDMSDVIEGIIHQAKAANIGVGIFSASVQDLERWFELGVSLFILKSDLMFMGAGVENDLTRLGKLSKEPSPAGPAYSGPYGN